MAIPKKRATKAKSRKRRGTGKRELVKNQADDFFVRRTGGSQFREMYERGRSQSQDRRRQGEGDRKARARRSRRPKSLDDACVLPVPR